MLAIARLLGRKASGDIEIVARHAGRPLPDETARVVTEVALYWGESMVRLDEHPPLLVASAADFGVPDDPRWDARAALPLPSQLRESVWAHFGDLSLRLTKTYAARPPGRFAGRDADGVAHVALSTLLHAAVVASLVWSFLGGAAATETITPERIDEMRGYLGRSDTSTGASAGDDGPRLDQASASTPGGTLAAREERGRAATRATTTATPSLARPRPSLDRADEVRAAATFGVLALLDGLATSGEGAVGAGDWGKPSGAHGAAWGDELGAWGIGGIDLSGVGEGGGGRGEGVEMGGVSSFGCGCGGSLSWGTHVTRSPRVRCGGSVEDSEGAPPAVLGATGLGCAPAISGRLPPEAVRRIVQQNHGRFRLCYENGLAKDPSLAGRVRVKFVIARDGSVSTSADAGSSLGDPDVVACVVRAFGNLSFPEPSGGIVTVVYPLIMSPE
jgi:hypothetical protein